MLRTIHLHGALGADFGASYRLNVRCPAEAIRALCSQLPGMQRHLAEGGAYRVVIGRNVKTGRRIGIPANQIEDGAEVLPHAQTVARDLSAPWQAGEADMHIVPVVRGRKSGTGKIIVGVIIAVVAIVAAIPTGGGSIAMGAAAFGSFGAATGITYGMIAMAGIAIALGGLAMAMSAQPKTGSYGDREAPDQRPSYLFNSVVNTVEQGGAVPLIYGKTMVGSQVIAMGIAPEDIPYVDNGVQATG